MKLLVIFLMIGQTRWVMEGRGAEYGVGMPAPYWHTDAVCFDIFEQKSKAC